MTIRASTADSLTDARAATGIDGLDHILHGGLPRDRLYLVEGQPGSGKTTLGLQFLLEGMRHGEAGLYVTLSETKEELEGVAQSHGWSLDRLAIFELASVDRGLMPDDQYTIFHPSEIELSETTAAILQQVERIQPARVVFDSVSEMRLLAGDSLRFRRQILALKQFFAGRRSTVMLLDDQTVEDGDLQLHSLAHGVIRLDRAAPEYGAERRRLQVVKLRGVQFQGGYHDCAIRKGGLTVFPRLVAAEHPQTSEHPHFASGIKELDQLFGGRLEGGTTALFLGPAGVGKSALAAHYAEAAAKRGQKVAMYLFDEGLGTFFSRAEGIGCDIAGCASAGHVRLHQIDAAEVSPGEFAHAVRQAVERDDVQLVVIDSLNGYLNSMPEERFLLAQLHELFTFLRQRGVLTICTMAQHGMLGHMQTPVDVSYLADTVVVMRYFEAAGEVRQAVSVMKKRSGRHERTIRELKMDQRGLRVGPPLKQFHGVLSGVPVYSGTQSPLLRKRP